MRVVIGKFDQKVVDEEEQVFLIKNISVHEKYRHILPMNYDIALLELNQRIQLGRFSNLHLPTLLQIYSCLIIIN